MAVIGCDIPVRVGGSEDLGEKAGVWVKTHFREEGHYLVATTFLVAAGSPSVFELRIDMRPLEKVATAVHQALHAKMAAASGTPTVGFSFAKAFRSIKKTAKKIGQTKLVKAVSKTVNSVVKNKVFQLALPVGAVAAHTLNKASGGKGVVPGALGRVIDMGTSSVMAVIPGGAAGAMANPKSLAAFSSAQAAIKAATAGKQLLSTANAAKSILAKGNAIAQRAVSMQTTVAKDAAKKSPAVQKALALKAKLNDPKVKAQLLTIKKRADSANRALAQVNFASKNASGAAKADAVKSRAIVNLVAQNQARIAQIAQRNAGGLPALLIDKKGKITRGKFSVKALPKGQRASEILYLGPGKTERGAFAKIGDGVSRIANDIIGGSAASRQAAIAGCFPIMNTKPTRNLKISGTAPGLIGCDCGSEF